MIEYDEISDFFLITDKGMSSYYQKRPQTYSTRKLIREETMIL